MTSQVVLLNAWGAAIASDSAVSSGSKVMHGSEKIFALRAPHKIAILTSANAKLMEFPWESIFASWEETLTKPLSKTLDYYTSLDRWLATDLSASNKLSDWEFRYLNSSIWSPLYDGLMEFWTENLSDYLEQHLTEKEFQEARLSAWSAELNDKVLSIFNDDLKEQFANSLNNLKFSRWSYPGKSPIGVETTQAELWANQYMAKFAEVFGTNIFEHLTNRLGFPYLIDFLPQVRELVIHFLMNPIHEEYTKICLTGFGEDDLLPSGIVIEIIATIAGVSIKRSYEEYINVTDSEALFFAQRDAIDGLVSGYSKISMDVSNELRNRLKSNFGADDVSAQASESPYEDVIDSALSEDYLDELVNRDKIERYEKPFLRALGMSPVRDLAGFAGMLVSVQAARAAFTQENPTVGGPVDVAYITKHEGLQWIQRK